MYLFTMFKPSSIGVEFEPGSVFPQMALSSVDDRRRHVQVHAERVSHVCIPHHKSLLLIHKHRLPRSQTPIFLVITQARITPGTWPGSQR